MFEYCKYLSGCDRVRKIQDGSFLCIIDNKKGIYISFMRKKM